MLVSGTGEVAAAGAGLLRGIVHAVGARRQQCLVVPGDGAVRKTIGERVLVPVHEQRRKLIGRFNDDHAAAGADQIVGQRVGRAFRRNRLAIVRVRPLDPQLLANGDGRPHGNDAQRHH